MRILKNLTVNGVLSFYQYPLMLETQSNQGYIKKKNFF